MKRKLGWLTVITGIVLILTSTEDALARPWLGWALILLTLHLALRPRRRRVLRPHR
jgi:hypothetical protein